MTKQTGSKIRYWKALTSCECDDSPYSNACDFCLIEHGLPYCYTDEQVIKKIKGENMFQSTPGTYLNKHAAHDVCEAFAKEEQVEWFVVKKQVVGDKGEQYFYRPCRKTELGQAIEDEWYPLTQVSKSFKGALKEPIHITSFAPADVAGFDLECHITSNGSFRFRDHLVGELPKEIVRNEITYTLEGVKKFDKDDTGEVFCNALYV